MYAWAAIVLMFVGCCTNVVCLELLITDCPGCGSIIIFCQFLFITANGFIFTRKLGKKARAVPLQCYIKMTMMYSFSVMFQNALLYLQFDIPLQQLLRSGTLIANLVLSVVLLKKTYRWSKYLSVIMISIGIALATVASTDCVERWHLAIAGSISNQLYSWLLGLFVLLLTFCTAAYMGIYQEIVFTQYGKHSAEALFYNHALVLPFFIFLSRDIAHHFVVFSQSEPMALPWIHVSVPKMWLYLIVNVLTQYLCVSSVFTLTAECSSLTVNFVLTLRKFLSLLLSVIYFNNEFTLFHWLGAILVFLGTLLYTGVLSKIHSSLGVQPVEPPPSTDESVEQSAERTHVAEKTAVEHSLSRTRCYLCYNGDVSFECIDGLRTRRSSKHVLANGTGSMVHSRSTSNELTTSVPDKDVLNHTGICDACEQNRQASIVLNPSVNHLKSA